jgi:hypothetical protein
MDFTFFTMGYPQPQRVFNSLKIKCGAFDNALMRAL